MVVGEPVEVMALDLHTCTVEEVMGVDSTPFAFKLSDAEVETAAAAAAAAEAAEEEESGGGVKKDAKGGSRRVSAFAGWFETDFHGSSANPAPNPVTLSTHPKMGYTHWGQQVSLPSPWQQ